MRDEGASATTCAWCGERCDPRWSYCITCGHEAHKAREECGCFICWPDLIVEVEEPTDVDRLNAQLKITRQWSESFERELEPGDRMQLITGLEIEIDERAKVYLLLDGLPIWSGLLCELHELHVYRFEKSEDLCMVAVNKKLVWSRTW